jgi:hypothetical protein
MKRKPAKRKRVRKNTPKAAIRCARDLSSVPFQVFHLPSDGERKWQAVCMRRRAVFQQLALAANQNGKSICLGAERIAADTGLGRATIFRILQDLRTLGFLTDEGKTHPAYHTRVRSLEVACALAAAKNAPSQINEGADSRKQPSQIKKQPSQINEGQSQINVQPSHQHPDPTEVHTEELTEEQKRSENMDCAFAQNAQAREFALPFDEEEIPDPPSWMREAFEDQPQEQTMPARVPIPREPFEEYRAMLEDAGVYGWREFERDNGCLRKLWELCHYDREQMRDALEYGIAEDDGKGSMATITYYAERRITEPEMWSW